jgi:hypothetical protein
MKPPMELRRMEGLSGLLMIGDDISLGSLTGTIELEMVIASPGII